MIRFDRGSGVPVYRGWPGIDTFASEAEVGWRVDITHCIDASSATANKATNKSASAPSVAGVQLCEEGTGRQEKYDRHSAGAGARHRRAYHRPTYREAPRRHADALPVTARRTHFQRHRTPRCIERLATRRLIVPGCHALVHAQTRWHRSVHSGSALHCDRCQ